MENCFLCGASSEKTVLYDAISSEGLVKICANCNIKENLPVLKKSGAPPGEKRMSVYERLTYMSGFNPKEREMHRQEEAMKKQNEEIKQVLDKRFKDEMMSSELKKEPENSGIVRNFHWDMMRARRARHLTQEQLAEAIGESALAIKMAERGVLPREKERLVRKIENYLKIKIMNMPVQQVQQQAQEVQEEQEVSIEEIKRKFSIRDLFGLGKKKEEKTGESPEGELK